MGSKLRIFDWSIVIVPMLLIVFGIAVIYTVSFPTVQFALARSQIIFAIIGLVLAAIVTLFDYRTWGSVVHFFYAGGLVLLLLVMVLGLREFGAARWIDLGFFQIQPSEIIKLVLILQIAKLLSVWQGLMTIRRYITVLLFAAIPALLIFKQPDLGTASVIVAIAFGMLLFAKLPVRWWIGTLIVALVLLPIGLSQLQPYQKARLRTFLSPAHDIHGQGYNVRQATIAVGSGGIFGQGLGQGSQSQLNFLPVAHTDFIFAGLAEATGLFGAAILLLLYFILIQRIFTIAELAKDSFGMFIALGIGVMFVFQIIVNIGMNLALLPVTGIPLPLISYGGTSLISNMICLGLLQSIFSRHKKITF